jgi:hypothetical protein
MTVEVKFELSDADLEHFRGVMHKAQEGAKQISEQEILAISELTLMKTLAGHTKQENSRKNGPLVLLTLRLDAQFHSVL